MLLYSTSQLRGVGLSNAKCKAVLSIARSVVDGEVRLNELRGFSDEDVIAQLIKLRGVGPWTAQMFLMFSLGRLDVFPTGDLGIVNAITALYTFNGRASENEMLELANSWRPYRTIASWYLWQAMDIFRDGEW